MTEILVLGAYGLLGSTLCPALTRAGHQVFRQGRSTEVEFAADPTDVDALSRVFGRCRPEVIVNLVAATNVDRCEEDPQAAFVANVLTVEAVAAAMRDIKAPTGLHLVQLSTDQVYDGPGLHREDNARPCNVYALSKYAGELAASRVDATILRTNFFGRSQCAGRTSLSDWVVHSLQAGTPITVFDDVLFSALHISTLCRFIELAVARRAPGVFNVGCRDGMSKAQFALQLAERLGLDTRLITVGTSRDVPPRARRPLDMRINVTHFEQTFGLTAPSLEEEIKLAAEEYRLA